MICGQLELYLMKHAVNLKILIKKTLVRMLGWADRSKERDRKSELVLGSSHQSFQRDQNNSDRNFDFWETNQIAADRII